MPNSENRQDTFVGRSSILWMNESHRLFKNGNCLPMKRIHSYGLVFPSVFATFTPILKIHGCFVKPNNNSLNIFLPTVANDPIFFN